MACSVKAGERRRIYPPTYFLICLAVAVASRSLAVIWAYSTPITLATAALLLAAGIALNLMSDTAFKRRGTPVSPDATPTQLVVSGAFRFTRNPMYLGMALIIAAAALLVAEPVAILAAAAFVWIVNRSFVPGEERNLELAFGDIYLTYKVGVRRWV